jgi:hypothetical protein
MHQLITKKLKLLAYFPGGFSDIIVYVNRSKQEVGVAK